MHSWLYFNRFKGVVKYQYEEINLRFFEYRLMCDRHRNDLVHVISAIVKGILIFFLLNAIFFLFISLYIVKMITVTVTNVSIQEWFRTTQTGKPLLYGSLILCFD